MKKANYKKVLRFSAFAIFLLFSNTALFNWTITKWEGPMENTQVEISKASNIVILGGYSSINSKSNKILFFQSVDRLLQALPIYHQNPGSKIILSGGSAEIMFEETPEATYLKDYLVSINIPEKDIFVESHSRNTNENAIHTKQVLSSINSNLDVILITSAFHMRRAKMCFEKTGIKVTPYYSHFLQHTNQLKPGEYFIPSLATLNQWPLLLKEWLGLLMYKINGYI
ncbi:YdcF family protein [Carboxylicivirga sp. N1Y90]|uniref:YdcF family protein n=1 Tax=Carboxylicivirga fragile TaxID=3417571 RepID=UPI003D3327E3|nr:YdcF family protein [Marinilabiliaceae bacterium N1Y90]